MRRSGGGLNLERHLGSFTELIMWVSRSLCLTCFRHDADYANDLESLSAGS